MRQARFWLVTLVFLSMLPALAKSEKMKTTVSVVTGATVTVIHFGAPWCGACMGMEPAWAQFESSYGKKVNLVHLNVDEANSPEMKKYGGFQDIEGGSLPYTVWLDSKNSVIDKQSGGLTSKQLEERTERATMNAH